MIKFPCRVCNKSVGVRHHAIECDICKTWVHIRCNKFDDNDYKFYQNNPDAPFYCINCTEENVPFSFLNDNQFKIVVEKGVNFTGETNIQFEPSPIQQQFFVKINNTINRLSFEANDDEDSYSDDDDFIDCKYYSIPEFDSQKFHPDRTFSILHLNIH